MISLYCFEYGVSPSIFLTRVRGGTCTTAASDLPQTVVHRAITGLLTVDRLGVGRSGQASSVIGAHLAALFYWWFPCMMRSLYRMFRT
ncbi:hypothetical protein OROHE_000119 [Orobanche hederae]